MSEHLLRQGMEHETSVELKEFLGRPVSPEALLGDIQRMGRQKLSSDRVTVAVSRLHSKPRTRKAESPQSR
jgi:hypothetical protein